MVVPGLFNCGKTQFCEVEEKHFLSNYLDQDFIQLTFQIQVNKLRKQTLSELKLIKTVKEKIGPN